MFNEEIISWTNSIFQNTNSIQYVYNEHESESNSYGFTKYENILIAKLPEVFGHGVN